MDKEDETREKTMDTLRKDEIKTKGGIYQLKLAVDHRGIYRIIVNGEIWADVPKQINATIIYDLIQRHLDEDL